MDDMHQKDSADGHESGGKPSMRILLANPRGFCAGVERAIEIVERALVKYGRPVYVRDVARAELGYQKPFANAFFLGEQEYPSVIMLYHQLHDRVITMHRVLAEAGLA